MPHPFTLVPNTWRGNFPHMSDGDRPLWLRYLDDHANEWSQFAYDVAVGGQEAPADVTDAAIRRAWHFNTAKRIDALGVAPGARAIFEIREQAGVGAVGSLVVYRTLLRADFPDLRPLRLILLTDHIAPDTGAAAREQGIEIITYPPS